MWNKKYEHPSFFSTTLLREHYSIEDIRHRKSIIKIWIPKGTQGTYIQEINPDRSEYEVLLLYHLKLRRIWNTYEVVLE